MKKIFAIALLGVSACVGSNLEYDRSPPKKNDLLDASPVAPTPGQSTAPADFLSGDVTLSDGSVVKLDELKSKPLVLVFAAEFCSVCKAEHERIIASLSNPAVESHKVKFLTLVVAMTPEDAQFWKEDRQVPWSVGADENLEMIDRFCGVRQTPCMVIQTPERGIVLKRRGEVSLDDIRQAVGGDWND